MPGKSKWHSGEISKNCMQVVNRDDAWRTANFVMRRTRRCRAVAGCCSATGKHTSAGLLAVVESRAYAMMRGLLLQISRPR
jgi:hypothetical protein